MIEGATGQCFPVICPILDRIVRKQDYSGCLKFPRRLDFLYVIRGIVHHTIDPNTSQSPPARRRFHSLLDLAYELPGTCGIRHRHYEVHGTFWSLQLRDPHRLPPLHVAPPIGVFVCTARVYPMQQMSARRRQPRAGVSRPPPPQPPHGRWIGCQGLATLRPSSSRRWTTWLPT